MGALPSKSRQNGISHFLAFVILELWEFAAYIVQFQRGLRLCFSFPRSSSELVVMPEVDESEFKRSAAGSLMTFEMQHQT